MVAVAATYVGAVLVIVAVVNVAVAEIVVAAACAVAVAGLLGVEVVVAVLAFGFLLHRQLL